MVNVRHKGAANERAVAKLYYEDMGVKLVRDIEQYRRADRGDLIPDGDFDWCFCIEVKARVGVNTQHDKSWWEQVAKAAKAYDKIPVLWYKFNRRPWRVVMQMCDVALALCPTGTATIYDVKHQADLLTMSPETHFYLAREILAEMA